MRSDDHRYQVHQERPHLGVPEDEAGAATVVDAEQVQLLPQLPVVPAPGRYGASASRDTGQACSHGNRCLLSAA